MSGVYIDPRTQDLVVTSGKDLQRVTNPTVASAYLRVATQRGSVFWDPTFGCDLQNLGTLGANAEQQAEAAVFAALQPMVAAGELRDLSVQVVRPTDVPNRLDIIVDAIDAAQRPIQFKTFVPV